MRARARTSQCNRTNADTSSTDAVSSLGDHPQKIMTRDEPNRHAVADDRNVIDVVAEHQSSQFFNGRVFFAAVTPRLP